MSAVTYRTWAVLQTIGSMGAYYLGYRLDVIPFLAGEMLLLALSMRAQDQGR